MMRVCDHVEAPPTGRAAELRGWALLGLASLAIAGALALLLALSRTPHVQDWLPWGPSFFHRALVTHVILSFEVWLLAALGALSAMVAGGGMLGRLALWSAWAGTLILCVPALLDQGEPSLNNYVPVLVHPLFYAGLALVAFGVGLAGLRTLPLLAKAEPAGFGIAAANAMFLAACLCFAVAWLAIPAKTDIALFNERLFWGGGHVLQFVNTAILMIAWVMLCERVLGTGPLPPAASRAAFASMLAFSALAPLLYLRGDVLGVAQREAFTGLLWWGLPWPPAIMGAGLAWLLVRRPFERGSAAHLALALSLVVFAVGGVAGFFLGVGDTRTPSHYHAVIGGVNLGLMGVFIVFLLPLLGRSLTSVRAIKLQFHLYGGGQFLHALGFFVAGAAGVQRKTAGMAQGLDSLGKTAAMYVVGLGAGIAVVGGVIFVWMVLARLLRRDR
jgi:hypothetical protein